MANLSDRFVKDESMVSREIAAELILVPIRQNAGDLESIYSLNETAALVWKLMDGDHSLSQILDQIVSEYEISREEAEPDLFEIVSQMEQVGALKRL